jgi:hypothetical protein
VQVVYQRGPYYVGEPTVVEVRVNGLDGNSDIAVETDGRPDESIAITGPQKSQSTSSFTQIINGRVTSHESVNLRFIFQVVASKAGRYQVGPFSVKLGTEVQTVEAQEFEFVEPANDPNMELEVAFPRSTFYVGERVPLSIQWAYTGDRHELQAAYSNLQIRSPIFDQGTFEVPSPTSRTTLTISTAQGAMEIDADISTQRRGDRDYVVVTGELIMVMDRAGTFKDIPFTCRTVRVTQWGRDLFGDLQPRSSQPTIASATPLSFVVKPLPIDGRPESFSGAVGRGFSIDVATNRSVVRVGDPITLEITVRGEGNLDQLSLPQLSSGGSLDASRFQLSSEVPAGVVQGSTKQFKVNVRIKDKDVDQLPAIPFSWFDPQQAKYVTTQSKPIALQVAESEIISAQDVVAGAAPDARNSEPAGQPPGPTQPSHRSRQPLSVENATSPFTDLVGANLAIENDIVKLQVSSSQRTYRVVVASCYLLGMAAVAVAIANRRLVRRSPAATQRKMLLSRARRDLAASKKLTSREAAQRIAEALRILLSQAAGIDRVAAERLVADCETHIYAPHDQDNNELKAELIRRAETVVEPLLGKQG